MKCAKIVLLSCVMLVGASILPSIKFENKAQAQQTRYAVTVKVIDNNGPIVGAKIVTNGHEYVTNNEGVACFDLVTGKRYTSATVSAPSHTSRVANLFAGEQQEVRLESTQ